MVAYVLYFRMVRFYEFLAGRAVRDNRHPKAFHVHVASNDNFRYGGHAYGVSTDNPNPVILCRCFEGWPLQSGVHTFCSGMFNLFPASSAS